MSFKINTIKMLDKEGREVKLDFTSHSNLNVIIGLNGSGKSYLLNIIFSSFMIRNRGELYDDVYNKFVENELFNNVEIKFSNDNHHLIINSETWEREDGYLTILCDGKQYYIGERHKEYIGNGQIVDCQDEEFPYLDDLNKHLPSNLIIFNNSKIEFDISRINESNLFILNRDEKLITISILTLIYAYLNKHNDFVINFIQKMIDDKILRMKNTFVNIQLDSNKSSVWFEKIFEIKEWNDTKGFYRLPLHDYVTIYNQKNYGLKDFFSFHYNCIYNNCFDLYGLEDFIQSLSDGQLNYSLLLCMTQIVADDNSLILLDEPDASIDYAKKIELIRMLKRTPGQLFITTHDPVLVSNVNSSDIIMLEDGHISNNLSFARLLAQSNNYNMLDALGIQGMPYLVVVEGPSDAKILKKAIEILNYSKYFNDVFFLSTGGSGNTKHFYEITLSQFPKTNIKKVLFVFDRDYAGYDGQKAINNLQKLHKGHPERFNSENITPNMIDCYLYRDYNKDKSYYETNTVRDPQKSKDAFDKYFYLENYIKEENYFYNGKKVIIKNKKNNKSLRFNEMKKYCPSESKKKRGEDCSLKHILSNYIQSLFYKKTSGSSDNIIADIVFGDNGESISSSMLENIVNNIKDDVLNGKHNDYSYFENFKYLLDDILDKLSIVH